MVSLAKMIVFARLFSWLVGVYQNVTPGARSQVIEGLGSKSCQENGDEKATSAGCSDVLYRCHFTQWLHVASGEGHEATGAGMGLLCEFQPTSTAFRD